MTSNYEKTYRMSIDEPEKFWASEAENIHWYKKWDEVLDRSNKPFYRWFRGGQVNTCYNALDIHVENGRGDQLALIYDSPVTGIIKKFTYKQLLDEVSLLAGALKGLGLKKGDTAVIYMPMIPEAVISMLACARIGAVHSVVFGGFAPPELATRIDDAEPKLIISASCGIEINKIIEYKPLVDKAIELSKSKPDKVVMYQRPQSGAQMIEGRDVDWTEITTNADPVECTPVQATDPLYILYTSGTTGVPKGVVRDNGGHIVALKWSMKNVFGAEPGEVYWAASDVGWVVGHSYIVYGPLFHGCTTVMYEGKPVRTPDPGAFWRVISEHGVSVMFTAPTAFRAIKRDDPEGSFIKKYNLDNFRALFLAGERCDPDTLLWAQRMLRVKVVDNWWLTETGWPIGANCLGLGELPVKPGSCSKPVPGYDMHVLGDDGHEMEKGVIGNITIKLPLPPGCMPTLWNNDEGFIKTYLEEFPGYFETGDAGYIDEDGYLWIMSRTDDIINVAGHRLSTGEMEEVLSSHKDVAECAVIGVADELKGELPVGLIVLKSGVERSEGDIIKELIQLIRDKIGPVASFKIAAVVERLPKTRSGKILRGTMKKIADGAEYRMPATIDDPAILDDITKAMKTLGYPHK
ncbi:MAG: propionyl-CoA synthetase [Candidatus Dadabacteria bacterium]|nr:propionyl-CoA synthetase [Candidatus Dadabacteria bacterium]NIS08238.1 propionyl-CoA synthetase [Candidatus Dadabacteria bacterium]NIV41505.1 acetate--CoA ligase [Candidatus Dadabacteria bacterium]NIY21726.1 acetate--CoA ligase [Candidatus Dadabacteria bacterium]